jgi:lipopolysaccharide/colanic/teichoic acid biosynthesis glycosyltransferase
VSRRERHAPTPGTVGKRVLDIGVAAVALALTLPVQLVAASAILLEDGRPVLFRQPRAGLGGREFRVIKFRTMRRNDIPPEQMGQVRGDHPLVTRTGRLLRRTKVDELPQLLNVVLGHMSLVGPRPALPSDLAGYDAYAWRRLTVRPGLTGWAQVNGSVVLSWPERILLDVWYVDHRCTRLDLAILVRTVGVLIGGERANPAALEAAAVHAATTAGRGTPRE